MCSLQPAWISLGSNVGDGKDILQRSWKRLGELPGIFLENLSRPWRSNPFEIESSNWFTNAVGKVKVELSPQELLYAMRVIEADFGRNHYEEPDGLKDRSLDLDLLYFGEKADVETEEPFLTLPHPRIHNRLFVLLPLQEIDPDLRDIRTGENVSSMIAKLQQSPAAKMQQLEVEQWPTQ